MLQGDQRNNSRLGGMRLTYQNRPAHSFAVVPESFAERHLLLLLYAERGIAIDGHSISSRLDIFGVAVMGLLIERTVTRASIHLI